MKKLLSLLLVLLLAFGAPAEAAFPTTFGLLTGGNQPLSLFDTMFGVVGSMGQVMTTATGTNSIVLTPNTNMPTITAYNNYQVFGFVAAASSTASITINVSGVGALPLYLSNGTTPAGSGALTAGAYNQIIYNSALNTGTGGFQLISNNAVSSSHGNLINVQKITATGTYTPTAGTNSIFVECIGGGGGGGSTAASGGTAGGAGGTTSLGTLCSANGGGGAPQAIGSTRGSPGIGANTSGAIGNVGTFPGSSGGTGVTLDTSPMPGSTGAPGYKGMGAGAGATPGGNGVAAGANTGAGGGGGGQSTGGSFSGGAGGGGSGGLSQAYATAITGTYAATIGAAGSQGSAGTSGQNGGPGGTGFILINEYN